MEPRKIQETKTLPVKLPLEKQQEALDAKTINFLKEQVKVNIFDGPKVGGKIEIHNGSLFSYTRTLSNTRVIKTNTGEHKTETKKQSFKYSDEDNNGTFETLIVETKDANGNTIGVTKYGKSKDDNVSNYDELIPTDENKK